jgi:hypothetical protein
VHCISGLQQQNGTPGDETTEHSAHIRVGPRVRRLFLHDIVLGSDSSRTDREQVVGIWKFSPSESDPLRKTDLSSAIVDLRSEGTVTIQDFPNSSFSEDAIFGAGHSTPGTWETVPKLGKYIAGRSVLLAAPRVETDCGTRLPDRGLDRTVGSRVCSLGTR